VTAAGIAAGVATQRLILRRARMSQTELVGEPFGRLPFDESATVTTPSGVELHVEIVEPADGLVLPVGFPPPGQPDRPTPTLVFVHGFCLDMGTFHFQRREFGRLGQHRMVFYDQPGHGRSTRLTRGEYTLDMLGDALHQVIEEIVPTGPIVLVGHSMGGMTIMALAESHPEMFGERVTGVVFISTSAGRSGEPAAGMSAVLGRFTRQLVPLVSTTGRTGAGVIDAARRASTDLAWLITRRYGFGSPRPAPALVSYVERMNGRTSTDVVARYIRALSTHARHPSLEALRGTKVLTICGDRDYLTPLAHSEAICRALPDARLVVVPDGGHVALLESPEVVNGAILAFLDEVGS